jgi:hypothetical protein
LRGEYKGKLYTAKIVNGKWVQAGFEERVFESPSAAAFEDRRLGLLVGKATSDTTWAPRSRQSDEADPFRRAGCRTTCSKTEQSLAAAVGEFGFVQCFLAQQLLFERDVMTTVFIETEATSEHVYEDFTNHNRRRLCVG